MYNTTPNLAKPRVPTKVIAKARLKTLQNHIEKEEKDRLPTDPIPASCLVPTMVDELWEQSIKQQEYTEELLDLKGT